MPRKLTITQDAFEEHLGPLSSWAHQCHAASIAMVKCDALWPAGTIRRVARGSCLGVGGQHSWIVLSHDCYDLDARVIDPTLWSYDDKIVGIHHDTQRRRYKPHGYGSIFEYGKPGSYGEKPIKIKKEGLSDAAIAFLAMVEPLDRRGWMELANAPVLGWPAREVIEAMDDTPKLAAFVPIDRLGMLTNANPGGLYLPDADKR